MMFKLELRTVDPVVTNEIHQQPNINKCPLLVSPVV